MLTRVAWNNAAVQRSDTDMHVQDGALESLIHNHSRLNVKG